MPEFSLKCSTLETLYLGEKQSMDSVSKTYGVSAAEVKKRMAYCGIQQRSTSETAKLVANRADIDQNLLNYLYWDLEMSTTDIAKRLNVDQSTIWHRLEKTRTKAEGSQLKPPTPPRRHKHVRSVDGYWMVKMPEHPRSDGAGYVKEAILKWEKRYREPFPEGCRLHYVNDDKDDLSVENLRAMTNSEHSAFHAYACRRAGCAKRGGVGGKCPSGEMAGYMKEWDEQKETEKDG